MFAAVWKDREAPNPARRYKIIAWGPNVKGVEEHRIRSANRHRLQHLRLARRPASGRPQPAADLPLWRRDRRLLRPPAEAVRGLPQDHDEDAGGSGDGASTSSRAEDFETWSEPKPAFVPDELDDAGTPGRIEEAQTDPRCAPSARVSTQRVLRRGRVPGGGSCTIAFPWLFTISGPRRPGPQEGPARYSLPSLATCSTGNGRSAARSFHAASPASGIAGSSRRRPRRSATAMRFGSITRAPTTATATRSVRRPRARPRLRHRAGHLEARSLRVGRRPGLGRSACHGAAGLRRPPPGVERPHPAGRKASWSPSATPQADPLPDWPTSEPFSGDSLRHVVRFPGREDLDALVGKPIRLRFDLSDAELYSFAFRRPKRG